MDSQHTPGRNPPANARQVVERKLKPDGTVREYPCTLLHLEPGLAVVAFVMARGGTIPGLPVVIPPGSVSYGYFWKRRPYNLYRMKRADGSLIAHRFDAVADVSLGPEVVSYRDLILDWWVLPGGEIVEEDRDELDAMVAAGSVPPGDFERTRRAAQAVFGRYRHVIDEAEALEAKLGLATPAVLYSAPDSRDTPPQ
ncbi:MAG: DUF402 domain-containing protein [Chloroflexi bacterium]|nr:DUF402 domain-containing protein [Chloroflexota bacterium]